jgi:hypothetical protein
MERRIEPANGNPNIKIPRTTLRFFLVYLTVMVPIQAATYYVDSVTGTDTNTGLAPTEAWRTLGKVSSIIFQPGDVILFKAGNSWTGTLSLHGSGTFGNPITVGRYGSGAKPLLQGAGTVTNVVALIDASYWEIADLEITNAGDPDKLHNGILVSSTSSQRYDHLYVRRVDVHDVDCPSNSGGGGIRMDGVLSDVLIDGCIVHHIGGNGIDVHSNYAWIVPKVQETYDQMADEDVTIQNCTTSFCGDSGIWIWGAKRAVIQYCTAHDCNLGSFGKYVGIWVMDVEDGVIQHNNSYNHRKAADGYCIDVDVLSFRVVVQYNYVHDNDQTAIIVFGYGSGSEEWPSNEVTVRYNVAEHCSYAFGIAGAQMGRTYWYNNTSYTGGYQVVLIPLNGGFSGTHLIANNIFYNGRFDPGPGGGSVEYNNNVYFETIDRPSDNNAIFDDPKLVAPGSGGDTSDSVDGYRLSPDSPGINAGGNIDDGGGYSDYWGNPVPVGLRDVGAHEFQSANDPPASPTNLRVIGD